MALSFEVSMDGKLLKARMAPKADAPSEDRGDHENQWEEDPLRCSATCWPEKGDQGELQSGMVVCIDFDDIGKGSTANQLLSFFARSVRTGWSRHPANSK